MTGRGGRQRRDRPLPPPGRPLPRGDPVGRPCHRPPAVPVLSVCGDAPAGAWRSPRARRGASHRPLSAPSGSVWTGHPLGNTRRGGHSHRDAPAGAQVTARPRPGHAGPSPASAARCFAVGVQAAGRGAGEPYARLHDHRLHLAVDRDLFAVPAWYRPVAFPAPPTAQGAHPPFHATGFCGAGIRALPRRCRAGELGVRRAVRSGGGIGVRFLR